MHAAFEAKRVVLVVLQRVSKAGSGKVRVQGIGWDAVAFTAKGKRKQAGLHMHMHLSLYGGIYQ